MWVIRKSLCLFIIVIIIHYGKLEVVTNQPRTCGYDGCPKPKSDMLNVHIVPHTHDDVGWVNTVDQYYYGSGNKFQKTSVQTILDSVISALLKDPEKRFIYVESAFFFKWWKEQTNKVKEQVKQLVNEGRLEFIGGAWSMNDEATTHYQSIVDQFTLGLRKLNDTFGECGRPKIGWQIDPFGHSREMASLLTQMGYDGLFFGRIDYQDKIGRLKSRNTEMIWRASSNLGSKADLFTGLLYSLYNPPPGFCFDVQCRDEPIIDDKNSPEYNIDRKVKVLLELIEEQANTTRTNNIILTMGGDFAYMEADFYYANLDRLIRYVNEQQSRGLKVNMFYSTPSCYLKSLYDSGVTFATKTDDFFPFATDPHSFWTGYFTSRPTLKRFERIGNHYLQMCKQLTVFLKEKTPSIEENLDNLREIMGVMQHHDAVSGTEKQHVANDYARLLQIGFDKCSENIQEALNEMSNKNKVFRKGNKPKLQFDYFNCANLNISACEVSENSDKFMVTLYNALGHSTSQYMRIPVPDSDCSYEVLDYKNNPLINQIVPIPSQVQSLFFRQSRATRELVFSANDSPALGYQSYFIQKKCSTENDSTENIGNVEPSALSIDDKEEHMSDEPFVRKEEDQFTIGNDYLNLTFGEDGLLSSVSTKGATMKVRQNFYIYESYSGYRVDEHRSSGAYIFRPKDNNPLESVDHADVRVIRGDLVDEVHQTFNEWISQVVRVYKKENYAEFQWLVGPVHELGREIISRFDTNIESNGIFYTDSNGREMLERRRNHRDTWNLTLSEEVSGNYYPVTTKIAIEDDSRRFAILTDRAQGGSSLADGSIELMIHRRLRSDDGFGVEEALNEVAYGQGLIVRGTHYIVFGPTEYTEKPSTEATERFVQHQILLPIWPLFSDLSDLTYSEWKDKFNHISSGLSLSLPKNVHLLTFEPWKSDSVLVRFEHILEKDEDEKYSQPVTFNFLKVFEAFDVASFRETTLSANQWLDEAKRLNFTAKIDNLNEIPHQWTFNLPKFLTK